MIFEFPDNSRQFPIFYGCRDPSWNVVVKSGGGPRTVTGHFACISSPMLIYSEDTPSRAGKSKMEMIFIFEGQTPPRPCSSNLARRVSTSFNEFRLVFDKLRQVSTSFEVRSGDLLIFRWVSTSFDEFWW